jgi:phage FluMu gp28-like protein
VDEGLVERINERTGRDETREGFIKRLHDECIDEDSWNQEYCCKPSDENSAFFTHEMITGCEDQTLRLMSLIELINYMQAHPQSVFYVGMDVGRHVDLCVIDVGEQIGGVIWDRCRIELQDRPYGEMKANLHPILSQPNLQRACLDGRGIGDQLGEEARYEFGWKVEPIQITAAIKEQLAIGLRRDFEDRRLRMVRDDKLRADLHSLRKLVTPAGNIRYDGQADDSHCDRTWAKALRQNAARFIPSCGGAVA